MLNTAAGTNTPSRSRVAGDASTPMDEYLSEMITELVVGRGYAYGDEFDSGLALILNGLEELLG